MGKEGEATGPARGRGALGLGRERAGGEGGGGKRRGKERKSHGKLNAGGS